MTRIDNMILELLRISMNKNNRAKSISICLVVLCWVSFVAGFLFLGFQLWEQGFLGSPIAAFIYGATTAFGIFLIVPSVFEILFTVTAIVVLGDSGNE